MPYQILSPDNFPISMENFKSKKEAIKYFKTWLSRYEPQGYYSTVQGGQRIQLPLVDVESYCALIKV